jgi:UV DNA damage endonuclease
LIRLGLCCIFREQPIRFRTTTVTALLKLTKKERLKKLSGLCMHNALALYEAIDFCSENGIGAFRVLSQILPIKTHPDAGYDVRDLPGGTEIIEQFERCGTLREECGLRLSFHPDQFVILNSPRNEVIQSSIRELDVQAEVADWIGADVLNIHGGGAYGDKKAALARLEKTVKKLPKHIRSKLTFENDDRTYTPSGLLPVCRETGVPLVYDAHHHRCLPDDLSLEEGTEAALETWNREPLFHLSSPREGWKKDVDWKPHHDFIKLADFPEAWKPLNITVDVEAKAKECAVFRLHRELVGQGVELWS